MVKNFERVYLTERELRFLVGEMVMACLIVLHDCATDSCVRFQTIIDWLIYAVPFRNQVYGVASL